MSAYANRPLLYLSQHHDAMLCRVLTQRGWKLSFASSLEDLHALPAGNQPQAALLDLHSGFSDADLESFEPWLAQPHIGWIGAVARHEALTETARRLLGLYFVDYYTAPFEHAELALARPPVVREAAGALAVEGLRPRADHDPPASPPNRVDRVGHQVLRHLMEGAGISQHHDGRRLR